LHSERVRKKNAGMMRRTLLLTVGCLTLGPAFAQAPPTVDDQRRVTAALDKFKAQRPGVVDAFVVVAALDTDPVFDREAREAARVLASRFDADGRSIVLAEDEGTDRADAAGTPANLAMALSRAAALMDQKEDVLILYTTSHGSPHAGLNYKHAVYGSGVITPNQLAAMLGTQGPQNRLVILQACFAGQFIPALASPRTVVATAASSMQSSFGCSADNDWTFFGHALINQAMRKPDSFVRQFRRAVVTIIGWEKKLGITPSNPQISVGSDTATWLAALDGRAGAVPPSPVGNPPSELAN
jgi:hypothetical protein